MSNQALRHPASAAPRITHVINSLGMGGAENSLLKILSSVNPTDASMNVVTLLPEHALRSQFQAIGIPVRSVSQRRSGLSTLLLTTRLTQQLKKTRPDVVVTWLYHSNLLGSLAAWRAGNLPVVWNIRHSKLDRTTTKLRTRLVSWLGGRLSHKRPKRVVYVAEASKETHLRQGYSERTATVIPNGFDLEKFRPSQAAAIEVRQQLDIRPTAPLIALVARFHPDKDPENFIRAASFIHALRPDAQFALCGNGMTSQNRPLISLLAQYGVSDVCHLLGECRDVSDLLAAADLAVLSSKTEAFPNVLGEAMACGTPCVSTDVGDVRMILGETGRWVPPCDSRALAQAVLDMLALPAAMRDAMGAKARERIQEHFTIEPIAERHLRLWLTAAGCDPDHEDRRFGRQIRESVRAQEA